MQTERLILRPFTLDDAEEYFPLVSHPDILRYTGETPVSSLDDARHILFTRPLQDYATYGFGRMACIEKATGKLIGFSGLKFLEDLKEVDVGYRFLPHYWGKGFATESAIALIEDGTREHNIERIIGLVESENNGSINVLKKLGLKFERKVKLSEDKEGMDMYALHVTSYWTCVGQ